MPLPATVPLGYSLLLAPYGTKTIKGELAAPIPLSAGPDALHSFVPRFMLFLSHLAHSSSGVHQHLFSPLTKDHKHFTDTAMTLSAIGKRVKQHLQAPGLYQGESNHGFRRGHIQADAADGMSTEQIGHAAQIVTAAIVELYKNPTRHTPRVERKRKRNTYGISSGIPCCSSYTLYFCCHALDAAKL